MTTSAQIAKEAFDAVATSLTDAIKVAQVTRPGGEGTYNQSTGDFDDPTPATETGRAVKETSSARIMDAFPSTAVQPTQDVWFLEGFTIAPEVGYTLTVTGVGSFEIKAVCDLLGSGTLFYVIAGGD